MSENPTQDIRSAVSSPDLDLGAEGEVAVGGGQAVHVVDHTAGGLAAVEGLAVPRRHAPNRPPGSGGLQLVTRTGGEQEGTTNDEKTRQAGRRLRGEEPRRNPP